MFGNKILKRVQAVITDEDSQEISQSEVSIKTVLLNAKRVRCTWHIIDRGWSRVGPKESHYPNANKAKYQEITSNIMTFLYSWTKPQCETKEG